MAVRRAIRVTAIGVLDAHSHKFSRRKGCKSSSRSMGIGNPSPSVMSDSEESVDNQIRHKRRMDRRKGPADKSNLYSRKVAKKARKKAIMEDGSESDNNKPQRRRAESVEQIDYLDFESEDESMNEMEANEIENLSVGTMSMDRTMSMALRVIMCLMRMWLWKTKRMTRRFRMITTKRMIKRTLITMIQMKMGEDRNENSEKNYEHETDKEDKHDKEKEVENRKEKDRDRKEQHKDNNEKEQIEDEKEQHKEEKNEHEKGMNTDENKQEYDDGGGFQKMFSASNSTMRELEVILDHVCG